MTCKFKVHDNEQDNKAK